MTFKNIQDEIIALRFDSSARNSIKSWINLSYANIWSLNDWTFAHVSGAALAVVGGNNAPTMPVDLAAVEGLYDNFGNRIAYLEPDQWRDLYQVPLVTVSTPSTGYTVIDGQIYLGPTPGGSATYELAYERRLAHVDGPSNNVAAGILVNDTDQAIWDAEWDYVLVLDACIIGGNLTDDLGVPGIQQQRDALLQTMKESLTSEIDNVEVSGQWGGSGYQYGGW